MIVIEKIKGYLRETLSEMKKVVWPNQRYVGVATLIILILVLVLGLLVMFMDLVLAKIFEVLLKI